MANSPKAQKVNPNPVRIWAIVDCTYAPSTQLVPLKEDREEIKDCHRWLILDDPFIGRLDKPAYTMMVEGAKIRMNRQFQPTACGGSDKAAANLKKFKDAALSGIPKEYEGKLRLLGEKDPIDPETIGTFTTLSSLLEGGKEQERKAEKRESLIKAIDLLGDKISEAEKVKLLESVGL